MSPFVFCGEDNLPLLKATLEKYFPLLPFVTGIIPEGVEGETPSADELLGEVPGENLMEEKTADQGRPEGENPNEEVWKGKSLVIVVVVTKEGNSLLTLVRRKYKKPEPPNLW